MLILGFRLAVVALCPGVVLVALVESLLATDSGGSLRIRVEHAASGSGGTHWHTQLALRAKLTALVAHPWPQQNLGPLAQCLRGD